MLMLLLLSGRVLVVDLAGKGRESALRLGKELGGICGREAGGQACAGRDGRKRAAAQDLHSENMVHRSPWTACPPEYVEWAVSVSQSWRDAGAFVSELCVHKEAVVFVLGPGTTVRYGRSVGRSIGRVCVPVYYKGRCVAEAEDLRSKQQKRSGGYTIAHSEKTREYYASACCVCVMRQASKARVRGGRRTSDRKQIGEAGTNDGRVCLPCPND